jgi:hypothetical protein
MKPDTARCGRIEYAWSPHSVGTVGMLRNLQHKHTYAPPSRMNKQYATVVRRGDLRHNGIDGTFFFSFKDLKFVT